MTTTRNCAVSVVLVVLTVGMMVSFAAALPGSAADQAHSHAHENAHTQELPPEAQAGVTPADEEYVPDKPELPEPAGDAGERADGHGPSVDLPEEAPDHVEQRLGLINAFLTGELDGVLGEHMRMLADTVRGNGQ